MPCPIVELRGEDMCGPYAHVLRTCAWSTSFHMVLMQRTHTFIDKSTPAAEWARHPPLEATSPGSNLHGVSAAL